MSTLSCSLQHASCRHLPPCAIFTTLLFSLTHFYYTLLLSCPLQHAPYRYLPPCAIFTTLLFSLTHNSTWRTDTAESEVNISLFFTTHKCLYYTTVSLLHISVFTMSLLHISVFTTHHFFTTHQCLYYVFTTHQCL